MDESWTIIVGVKSNATAEEIELSDGLLLRHPRREDRGAGSRLAGVDARATDRKPEGGNPKRLEVDGRICFGMAHAGGEHEPGAEGLASPQLKFRADGEWLRASTAE